MIVFAGIVPHPPLLIPGISDQEKSKVKKTSDAYKKFAADLALADPDTVIIISPHMVHYPHLFNICGMPDLVGTFEDFGQDKISWRGHNEIELAEEIVDKSEDEALPAILYNNGEGEYQLDHGVSVPNYFISRENDNSYRLLPIGYSIGSRAEHYTFGQVISQVCEKRRFDRIAIIASGDLSHRLIEDKSGNAKKFDHEMIAAIEKGDEYSIINMDEGLVDSAGECGYKSILILLGALSGRDYQPSVLSYEGPFGVGYMVANMNLKS